MHHTLKFYGGHRKGVLKFYMFWARWSRLPLLGWLVRWMANYYGRNLHNAYLLTAGSDQANFRYADALVDAGLSADGASYVVFSRESTGPFRACPREQEGPALQGPSPTDHGLRRPCQQHRTGVLYAGDRTAAPGRPAVGVGLHLLS